MKHKFARASDKESDAAIQVLKETRTKSGEWLDQAREAM
jgi:hypothetical protein